MVVGATFGRPLDRYMGLHECVGATFGRPLNRYMGLYDSLYECVGATFGRPQNMHGQILLNGGLSHGFKKVKDTL